MRTRLRTSSACSRGHSAGTTSSPCSSEREKLVLLERLAQTLDEQQSDLEAAYDVCSEILVLRPKHAGALARMEQIDERTGNVVRLLATLERRVALAPRPERPELFVR